MSLPRKRCVTTRAILEGAPERDCRWPFSYLRFTEPEPGSDPSEFGLVTQQQLAALTCCELDIGLLGVGGLAGIAVGMLSKDWYAAAAVVVGSFLVGQKLQPMGSW